MKNICTVLILALTINAYTQIPTTGLVAYYPFSGNANDMSGNGYNGIVNGATLTQDRFGNFNEAYSFDGNNDYIDLSNYVSDFNFSQPASISFWVVTKYDIGQAVYSTNDGGSSVLYEENIYVAGNVTGTLSNEIIVVSSQRDVPDNYITGFTTTSRDTLVDDSWHHIVIIYNNSSTEIYLDNHLLSLNCNFGTNNGHFGNLPVVSKTTLGARYNGGYGGFLKGSLDDLRFYNTVLTPAEITDLYQETITADPKYNYFNSIRIYPNPTQDYVMINTGNYLNMPDYTIKIEDNLGQTVFQNLTNQQLFQININDFGTYGIYFVKLFDDTGNLITVRKIILQ